MIASIIPRNRAKSDDFKGFREMIAFIIPRNRAKSADFKEFRRGDCFSSLEIVLISKDLDDDYIYHPLKSCKTT